MHSKEAAKIRGCQRQRLPKTEAVKQRLPIIEAAEIRPSETESATASLANTGLAGALGGSEQCPSPPSSLAVASLWHSISDVTSLTYFAQA